MLVLLLLLLLLVVVVIFAIQQGVKGKPLPGGGLAAMKGGGPSPINPFAGTLVSLSLSLSLSARSHKHVAGVGQGSLDSMISQLRTGTDQRLHRKSFRGRINAGDKQK
jgi:hypothetical protein